MKPAAWLILALVALGIGGCGRKANPQPPAGSLYPMHYPASHHDGDGWIPYHDDLEPGTMGPGITKGDGQ